MSENLDKRHPLTKYSNGPKNPMNRIKSLFRVQLVRALKSRGVVPEIMDQLILMATEGQRRVKVGETGEVLYVPVDEKTQYAACSELLNRAVGKVAEHKIIEDNRESESALLSDFSVIAGALGELGQPMDQWPPQVSEWYIRNEQRRLEGP